MDRQAGFSRREFLKLGGLALGALGFSSADFPFSESSGSEARDERLPPEDRVSPVGVARVTIRAISLFKEPSYQSKRLGYKRRDQLVDIIEEIISPDGPYWNPRWYRLVKGFAHSAYLQRVEESHLNEPLRWVPKNGQLGEVTVPYVQSLRYMRDKTWQPLYRLYYGTVYWITHLDEGPDGQPWYGLTDDRLHVVYSVPAAYLRPIDPQEIAPISPQVPAEEKRIRVSLAKQQLKAFEGDQLVYTAPVASGVASHGPTPNDLPTDTPQGNFHVMLKTPSRHMGDGDLTSDLSAYELPGVPWCSFFHAIGVAFHGTYWHDNFGIPMSHGCVNMRNEDAKWLYRWTTPEIGYRDWYMKGWGTRVEVV